MGIDWEGYYGVDGNPDPDALMDAVWADEQAAMDDDYWVPGWQDPDAYYEGCDEYDDCDDEPYSNMDGFHRCSGDEDASSIIDHPMHDEEAPEGQENSKSSEVAKPKTLEEMRADVMQPTDEDWWSQVDEEAAERLDGRELSDVITHDTMERVKFFISRIIDLGLPEKQATGLTSEFVDVIVTAVGEGYLQGWHERMDNE